MHRAGRQGAARGAGGGPPPGRARGFTLLETMLALLIVGVGVLAFVEAQASFTRSNSWSSQSATAMLLANEIRQLSDRLPRHDPVSGLTRVVSAGSPVANGWGRESDETLVRLLDDVDDLDGLTFGEGGNFDGPIDAFGDIVPEIGANGIVRRDDEGRVVALQNWRQVVSVSKVDPFNFDLERAAAYEQAATSQWPRIAVNEFPLRVTVCVEFRRPGQTEWEKVTELTWVVPVR